MTDKLENLKWLDKSTARPVEKARRVLKHLADMDMVYFFSDGFPRYKELVQDAINCKAVLDCLDEATKSVTVTTENTIPIGKVLSQQEVFDGKIDLRGNNVIWINTPPPGYIYGEPVSAPARSLSVARLRKIAETLPNRNYSGAVTWGQGYRPDADERYTIPNLPMVFDQFAEALIEECKKDTAPDKSSQEDAVALLKNLVNAMDNAFICNLQSTSYWNKELDAAREFLNAEKDKKSE
jgi:hypothetical protein